MVSRRRAMVPFDPKFIDLISTHRKEFHVIVESGLPEDARYITCYYRHDTDRWYLVYESDEFDEIIEGEVYPERLPVKVRDTGCPNVGLSEVGKRILDYVRTFLTEAKESEGLGDGDMESIRYLASETIRDLDGTEEFEQFKQRLLKHLYNQSYDAERGRLR